MSGKIAGVGFIDWLGVVVVHSITDRLNSWVQIEQRVDAGDDHETNLPRFSPPHHVRGRHNEPAGGYYKRMGPRRV